MTTTSLGPEASLVSLAGQFAVHRSDNQAVEILVERRAARSPHVCPGFRQRSRFDRLDGHAVLVCWPATATVAGTQHQDKRGPGRRVRFACGDRCKEQAQLRTEASL